MATATAISEWQRAVCAVKFKNPTSEGVEGSCFVIDAQRGLLWTCSHVVGQLVGETRQLGTSPAAGAPVVWMYEAIVVLSTPPQGFGLDGALLRITARLAGGALHPLTHADGQLLPALPLGDDTELSLPGGEPAILLGYPSVTQIMTPTVGVYSTRKVFPNDGEYLLTDSLMLPGHSGGPGLNQHGQVVGWNVRDQGRWVGGVDSGTVQVTFANGVRKEVQLQVACGINQLRPVSRLVAELEALQGQAAQDALGFAGINDVRAFLAAKPGCIAAGTHVFGPAAFDAAAVEAAEVARKRAEAAAQQAEISKEAAEQAEANAAGHAVAAAGQAAVAGVAATDALTAAGQASCAAEAAQSMVPHLLRVASAEDAERDYQRKRKAVDDATEQAEDAGALARQKRQAVLTANAGVPSCAAASSSAQHDRPSTEPHGSVAKRPRPTESPDAAQMLVVFSSPLSHEVPKLNQKAEELAVPPLNQKADMDGLVKSLEEAGRAVHLKAIFANTDSLRSSLTTQLPTVLHFSGHVRASALRLPHHAATMLPSSLLHCYHLFQSRPPPSCYMCYACAGAQGLPNVRAQEWAGPSPRCRRPTEAGLRRTGYVAPSGLCRRVPLRGCGDCLPRGGCAVRRGGSTRGAAA